MILPPRGPSLNLIANLLLGNIQFCSMEEDFYMRNNGTADSDLLIQSNSLQRGADSSG